jgi:murein DD-endopeptidase MepM/ murein hydrolase activator NlpD
MSDWQNARPKRFAVVQRSLPPVRFELHPFAVAALALVLLVLLGWSGATTTYALFRDEFLMQILSRSAAMERASNAEISRLKNDLERTSSRLLVERENFINKLDVLSRRQADVERRQETLSTLATQTGEAPADEMPGELRLGDDETLRESRASDSRTTASQLAAGYDALEHRQKNMMAGLRTQFDSEHENLSEAYAALGLTPVAAPVKAGLGGLYLPFGFGRPDALTRDLNELEDSAADVQRLRGGLDRVPLRSPATPGAGFTSGFGNRPDPFLGKLAFHSGVDFEAAMGSPARVTASGTVVSAGWHGNYGLMVEVKHDHGYTTRYAHLSSIAVAEGQDVRTGDIIGHTGSTGRSTGPHLHYETRLNDAPLDPRHFLKVGAKLD